MVNGENYKFCKNDTYLSRSDRQFTLSVIKSILTITSEVRFIIDRIHCRK